MTTDSYALSSVISTDGKRHISKLQSTAIFNLNYFMNLPQEGDSRRCYAEPSIHIEGSGATRSGHIVLIPYVFSQIKSLRWNFSTDNCSLIDFLLNITWLLNTWLSHSWFRCGIPLFIMQWAPSHRESPRIKLQNVHLFEQRLDWTSRKFITDHNEWLLFFVDA